MQKDNNTCDTNDRCDIKTDVKCSDRPLAMAYVEWQKWQNVYPADVGFERGTLFEDLDLPFLGEEVFCDE